MKRILLYFVLTLATNIILAQENNCKIETDSWQQLQVQFSVGNVKVGEVNLDGTTFSTLSIENYFPSSNYGEPCLPTFSQLIEVPLCDGFDVEITDAVYDTLKPLAYRLLPSQLPRSKSDTTKHSLLIKESVYQQDYFYTQEEAFVEQVGVARDRRLARLQFSPIRYNPVSGVVVVCRQATVTVLYRNADATGTQKLFERYHTPAFNSRAGVLNRLYPAESSANTPIRYLIVAHSMFRDQMDNFIEWKRRKGFITDIVYTDDEGVGSTSTDIQSYIRSQYTNATAETPAPTYLLIVGDHAQIPAFTGITSTAHITDLYYTTWTEGDSIPDCYYGRFSAQNLNQLTPQIDKTLMYEQYTFADPSFLNRAVMVAGVDGGELGDYGYTHADPAMDYAIIHYINGTNGFREVRYFKNDTSIVPAGASNVYIDGNSSSMSATVRSYYNAGAGWINYSAHGSATSWGTPNFTTSHVSSMTNTQKFGLVIGNCCLTNKFQTSTCFGEALLRKGNYCGAVGYIGGSNSTYWGEDFYWAVGLRGGIGPLMSMDYNSLHLGAYDRICHTHGEDYPQWAITQASLMTVGNMAVESSTSSLKKYYWEIYHLMGDPSVMPYITQADTFSITAQPTILSGLPTYHITAIPYAYVAITDTINHTLVASGWANEVGDVIFNLPSSLAVGGYEIVASAQQYRTTFKPLNVIAPDGAYVYISSIEPSAMLTADSSVSVDITLENIGDNTAYNVVVSLAADNPELHLSVDSLIIDSIPAGSQISLNTLSLTADYTIADSTLIPVSFTVSWDSSELMTSGREIVVVLAPEITVTYAGQEDALLANTTGTLSVILTNKGHAPLTAKPYLLSPTGFLSVVPADTSSVFIPMDTSIVLQYTLHSSEDVPSFIFVPLTLNLINNNNVRFSQTHNIYIGEPFCETFEGNSLHLSGWTQNAYPWTIVNEGIQGEYCIRSASGLGNYQTSTLSLSQDVVLQDSIKFYYKVSSEEGYDKFTFSIDEQELLSVSGEVDWTLFSYPISAGSHNFVFSYSKDVSISRGSDCAWIDKVSMPFISRDVTFQNNNIVCQNSEYIVNNDTINTDSAGNYCHSIYYEDSTVLLLDYSVRPPSYVKDSVVACDSYIWDSVKYTCDTTITKLYTDSFGCDSTFVLTITINHSVLDTIAVTAYTPNYIWNEIEYTQSGTYTQSLLTSQGCDSIVTLQLTIEDTLTQAIDIIPAETILVYPNPTTGVVHLSLPATEVVVYDAVGKAVACYYNVKEIDFGALSKGVYTLRLKRPEGISTHQVVYL